MREKLRKQHPYISEMELDQIILLIETEDVTLEEATARIVSYHELP